MPDIVMLYYYYAKVFISLLMVCIFIYKFYVCKKLKLFGEIKIDINLHAKLKYNTKL